MFVQDGFFIFDSDQEQINSAAKLDSRPDISKLFD